MPIYDVDTCLLTCIQILIKLREIFFFLSRTSDQNITRIYKVVVRTTISLSMSFRDLKFLDIIN